MAKRIPTAKLLSDLERVGEKLNRAPSKTEYDEYGDYNPTTLIDRFGSWNEAKTKTGYDDPNRKYNISVENLREDLHRVAGIVGRPPSRNDYAEYGTYSVRPFYDRFDTWTNAREELGLEGGPQVDPKLSTDELIGELKRLAEAVGGTPTRTEMRERGNHGTNTYRRHFGSWTDAVQAAGLEPNEAPAKQESCPVCGEQFSVHTWREQQAKDSLYFCSLQCHGEHRRDEDAGYVYYGPEWPQRREARREKDGYECVDCGLRQAKHREQYGTGLEVHHIRPFREFDSHEEANRLENLRTLCKECHWKWERMAPLRPDTLEN